jgi:hypothetical protein
VKAQLRSGLLYSCLLFLIQATTARAQDTAQPQQPAPPAQTTPSVQAAPPPPPVPVRVEDHDTGGDAYSLEPLFWLTKTAPVLRLGFAAKQVHTDPTTGVVTPGQTVPGDLNYGGGSKYGLGGVITIPTGRENSVQASYFRIQGDGSTTATQNLILFTNSFPKSDVLNTSYKIENYKISLNYLSFPYPSNGSKFRLKTLWEFQYLNVSSVISAPLDINAVNTTGNKHIFLPTLGIGLEYHPSKHVRLEAKGSGFGILHHMDIWDTEASLVVRFGKMEAFVGGKAYHFKTTPKGDQYFTDTLYGPSAGLRYIFR